MRRREREERKSRARHPPELLNASPGWRWWVRTSGFEQRFVRFEPGCHEASTHAFVLESMLAVQKRATPRRQVDNTGRGVRFAQRRLPKWPRAFFIATFLFQSAADLITHAKSARGQIPNRVLSLLTKLPRDKKLSLKLS